MQISKSTYILVIIIGLLCLFSSNSFGQDSTEDNGYERGVIKVRKANNVIIEVFDPSMDTFFNVNNRSFRLNNIVDNRLDIVYPPCRDKSWLKYKWVMKGQANRAFNREYIIDELLVNSCEDITLNYIKDGDTTSVKGKLRLEEIKGDNIGEIERIATFSYQKEGETIELKFDYFLNVNRIKEEYQPRPDLEIIYDTISMSLDLKNTDKLLDYSLVWGGSASDHNFFPGVCQQMKDTIHQWISDSRDQDGFKHKIIFRSCTEIEIQYRNPKDQNRKGGMTIKNSDGKSTVELSRQRVGVSDKYFNATYTIEFKDNKLILSNELETFTYSVYTK